MDMHGIIAADDADSVLYRLSAVTDGLLGCTVDYAILVTSRYIEIRLTDQRDHKPVLDKR